MIAEPVFFFGKMPVRKATRIVSYVHLVCHMVNVAYNAYNFIDNWHSGNILDGISKLFAPGAYYNYRYLRTCHLFFSVYCSILIAYSSYNLNCATHKYNLRSVKFWLLISVLHLVIIQMSLSVVHVFDRDIVHFHDAEFLSLFIVWSLESYTIYVVCLFYKAEKSYAGDGDGLKI